jgi:DNA invertase Pin-like site-specific DNA recombinase
MPQPTAVLYARVSSKEQEKEGFSIPSQQKLLRQYALDHGIAVAHEFTDVETAKRSGRTGFGEMLSYLRRHSDCRTILVEKTDRLYRNIKDWVTIDELGVEVHFVKQGTVISPDSRSSDKFMHGIQVLMAKNYIDNLSEETRKGMLEKAEQGLWPSFAPLGYLNVNCSIIPDPAVATIIRNLFEWYATGEYSLADVTKMARAAGMVFRKSGSPVPKGTVAKILRNRIYTGDFDFDGKTYRGRYEPIISRELWQRVQQALDGRHRRKRRHDFAFSGLIACGQCGRAMVGELKKGRYVYYHCPCASPYVREELLEAEFTKAVRRLVFTPEFLVDAKLWLQQANAKEIQGREQTVARLRTERTKLERRIEALYEDKLDGVIDEGFYKRKTGECRAELARLAVEIERQQGAGTGYVDNLAELANRAAELFEQQPATEKRKLLRFLVEECRWTQGQLTFKWKLPFERVAGVGEQQKAA